jgi:molybdopterin synthase catalytic subunit
VRITVLFFGMAREIAGTARAGLTLSQPTTVGALCDDYARRDPRFAALSGSLLFAVNAGFAPRERLLEDGDELAFLPPVSGGAGPVGEIADPAGHYYALTRDPIDAAALGRRLLRSSCGALATFEGVVRDHSQGRATRYLEYEAYETMALKEMARLGAELAAEHEIDRIAMVHRLGRIEIGETSVAIVVTAPHRRAAFAACQAGIDRLKKTVPVWKREIFADGAAWVEGEWDESLWGR